MRKMRVGGSVGFNVAINPSHFLGSNESGRNHFEVDFTEMVGKSTFSKAETLWQLVSHGETLC